MVSKHYIITISRGYGSGGKYIATKLAKELNIKLIDRDILRMASIESGISEAIFGEYDETANKSFVERYRKNVYEGVLYPPESKEFTSRENLFSYQAKVLMSMVQGESFVVLGRAANYVLRHAPNVVSINIQAPYEDCVESIMGKDNLSLKEAMKKVRKIDKTRSDFYRYHTGFDWLDVNHYDLCLNSSRIGRDHCGDVIKDFVKLKTGIDPRLSEPK